MSAAVAVAVITAFTSVVAAIAGWFTGRARRDIAIEGEDLRLRDQAFDMLHKADAMLKESRGELVKCERQNAQMAEEIRRLTHAVAALKTESAKAAAAALAAAAEVAATALAASNAAAAAAAAPPAEAATEKRRET